MDEYEKWLPKPKVVAGLLTVLGAALVLVALGALGVAIPDVSGLIGMLGGGAASAAGAYVKSD